MMMVLTWVLFVAAGVVLGHSSEYFVPHYMVWTCDRLPFALDVALPSRFPFLKRLTYCYVFAIWLPMAY